MLPRSLERTLDLPFVHAWPADLVEHALQTYGQAPGLALLTLVASAAGAALGSGAGVS